MIKSESFTINNVKYEVGYFKALEGLQLYTKFLAYLGDGFNDLTSIFSTLTEKENVLDANIDFGKIGSALNSIVKHLYLKGDVDKLVVELLSTTKVKDELITVSNFDDIFTGKSFELMEILKRAIWVNFKGFFQSHVSGILQKITPGTSSIDTITAS